MDLTNGGEGEAGGGRALIRFQDHLWDTYVMDPRERPHQTTGRSESPTGVVRLRVTPDPRGAREGPALCPSSGPAQ